MVTSSFPLRDKPSSPMRMDHTVSSYMSTRWDKIPEAPRTFHWTSFLLPYDPQNGADNLSAKLSIVNRLSPLVTQHKLKNVNKFGLLQMKLLKAQKMIKKTGGCPLLMHTKF